MTFKEVVSKVLASPILYESGYKNHNSIDLSGWVLRKPKFIKNDKTGIESCSLILYQINQVRGETKMETFSLMVYVKDLIDQLKQQDKVLYIATVGKLRYSKIVKGLYSQVTEMETLFELDIPLAEEWGKKE